jgi:carboxylesterase type B
MQPFLAVGLLFAIFADAQSFRVGNTVKTTTGNVIGQSSSWKPEVSEYLGIPFAEPPIGKLRWAAPVPIKAPGKVINATKYVMCFRMHIQNLLF